ncbi:hypothetical protein IQ250_07540 [Pseudanabaenaceae cyanobacterium LEGE 13415]|nr:hypothetical protein [Pseudanabaenaceae cyanobacterium LEGE 13415]
MYNLNLASYEEPPQDLVFSHGYDRDIDFFVWVLEIDGLQVSPFNQHPDGDRSLRSRGITADGWQAWLTNTIRHLHYGQLLLDYDSHTQLWQSIQPQMKQSALEFARRTNADLAIVEANLDRYFAQRAATYEQALTTAKQLYGEEAPPDVRRNKPPSVWQGEPAVADRLYELWSEFLLVSDQRNQSWDWLNNSNQEDDEPNPIPQNSDRIDLWTRVQQYRDRIKSLKIYLVGYSYSVECVIPPNSLLISASLESQTKQCFDDRIVSAVERLALCNASQQP